MERLKSILADKILDLSGSTGDEVKAKIDRIHRFRDFANACRTLMLKYPAIEDELIDMVNHGDYDTKVASSRVDSVIRFADAEASQTNTTVSVPASETIPSESEVLEETFLLDRDKDEEEPAIEDNETQLISVNPDDIPMEIYKGEEEHVYLPQGDELEIADDFLGEDTGDDVVVVEENEPENTVDYLGPDTIEEPTVEEVIPFLPEEDSLLSEDELAAAKRKMIIRRTVQVIGVIAAIALLIVIIKFVMVHWQTILIVAGIAAVLAILIYVLVKRKRS